jgi:hypothetical protein
MHIQIPQRVMEKATALWRGVDQDQAVLEAIFGPGTNVPVYFIRVEGIRLARMVTADDSFFDPVTVMHPPSVYNLLEGGSPMWWGWNERAVDGGIPREFNLLKENIRSKRFALVGTTDYNKVVYLIYHVVSQDDGMVSFFPAAWILDDGRSQE